ncbi:MAG TPA: hypothetical protein ENH85_06640 [Candidatus Scalindua sp.]|nr:hypothetical protein [Candidatus Scalindua sp.]
MDGKLFLFLGIVSGLMLLFYFTGLTKICDGDVCDNAGATSELLDLLLSPDKISFKDMGNKGQIALVGIAAVVAGVGLFISGKPELALIAPFAIFLMSLVFEVTKILSVVYSVNPVIALLLFSPLMILIVPTVLEWWRGRD